MTKIFYTKTDEAPAFTNTGLIQNPHTKKQNPQMKTRNPQIKNEIIK